MLAAPAKNLINPTLFTTVVFVVVNLGTTAESTKVWYMERFGTASVKERWRMIPYVW